MRAECSPSMPSECSPLPTWVGSTFCDPMKGYRDNSTTRRQRGEWVPRAGKSAQSVARASDARWRWLIGRGAVAGVAGYVGQWINNRLAFYVLSGVAALVLSLVSMTSASGAPILTGGEGVDPHAWLAHNDPIRAGRILSQWHRLPPPRDCTGVRFRGPKKRGGTVRFETDSRTKGTESTLI